MMPPTLAFDIRRVVREKRSTRGSYEGSTSMTKTIRRPLAAATHFLYETYSPGFLEYPTIVALHVIQGR
jgi:hypothetical protein